jgi:hypothetical protein
VLLFVFFFHGDCGLDLLGCLDTEVEDDSLAGLLVEIVGETDAALVLLAEGEDDAGREADSCEDKEALRL